MPRMDAGPTDGPPGAELATVWVTLSQAEALDLLGSLQVWAEEIQEAAELPPGWHTHIADEEGRELTIAIDEPELPSSE